MVEILSSEAYQILFIYKEIMEKIKKDEINPFEVSLDDLKSLVGGNLFTNGLVISLLSKIVKLKAEYLEKEIVPPKEKGKEAIKRVFKEVLQEEINLEEEEIEALLMIDSIKEKLKKQKAIKPKRITQEEFQEITKKEISGVLFEDTDYNSYALEIAKKIEKGNFKIKSYKDFIGLMFAIYLFNLQINNIKEFI